MPELVGVSHLKRVIADLPPVALALGMVVLLARTIWDRIHYPYDLEWMEGGMLLHAQRVADGLPLYVEPSTSFIPFIYPPLYPWIVGGLSLFTELDYALGRSVSLVGVVAACAALWLAIRREGGSIGIGVGAMGLFLCCYPDSGAFYDLVRNDGLWIGLVAWALVSVRMGWIRAGGLLLTAAFATKHTAALLGLPLLWWLWHHEGKERAVRFVAWSVVPALAFTVGMSVASGGLFLTYVLEVPSVHPFVAERFFILGPKEFAKALPWTNGLLLLVAIAGRRATSAGGRFWLVNGTVILLLALVMRGHHGGFLNVLIPGFWVLSLWAGLAASHLRKRHPHVLVLVLTGVVIAWQLWTARWDPARYVPTAEDIQAGDDVVAQLAEIDGEILSPWSPYLPVQAGKSGSIALIALWDIDHKKGPLKRKAQVIKKAIEAQHWAAVLTSKGKLKRGLEAHYKKGPFTRPKGKAMYTKTGWRVRPKDLYLPR